MSLLRKDPADTLLYSSNDLILKFFRFLLLTIIERSKIVVGFAAKKKFPRYKLQKFQTYSKWIVRSRKDTKESWFTFYPIVF